MISKDKSNEGRKQKWMRLRGYFEKVSEVGIVATILGLKICEILELRFDLKQDVHHFLSDFA